MCAFVVFKSALWELAKGTINDENHENDDYKQHRGYISERGPAG